ncbi:nuclear transport factor 2 family protein [Vogesella sp. LIG4]|uniref:nuclear transport factor 2 family protein n=1 Tax=Vogesella sp. LIG4 TaxID=1192162 RepID=UPI00081F8838|nr:nuclear transport factor 2 family protein [Vogesella sp. LIG4]SCK26050.1 SnoaL-like domain-containing protein [Vogesella sp. LIG4]
MSDPLACHLDWFASLSPQALTRIDRVYAAGARFQDPFHELHGREAIRQVYARMFRHLARPRFVIGAVLRQGDAAFVSWDFHFAWHGRQQQIHGGTLLRLDSAGLICEHRDYWDAAAGVYEQLPVLGWLLRRLKRHMA